MSLETLNLHFEEKWALQGAIVGNWMKKWSVNTDNMVTAKLSERFFVFC